jgi:hypothetical protein
MKKMIATVLLSLSLFSFGTVTGVAAEQHASTVLTVENQDEWVLHIPASQSITEAVTQIGNLWVSGGVSADHYVEVKVRKNNVFTDTLNPSNKLDYVLFEEDGQENKIISNVDTINFFSQQISDEIKKMLLIQIPQEQFDNMKVGTYQTTISFYAEVKAITK